MGEQAVRGIGLDGAGRRHARGLVGLRADDLTNQLFERPTLRDKPRGEMIEQFRMARLLAGGAEVVDGGDDAAAEEPAPDAVDQHAGGERIVGRRDPGGEQQPGRRVAGMARVAIKHLEIPSGGDVTGLRRLPPLLHGRIEARTLRGHRGRSPELRDALFDLPILIDEQRNRVAQCMDVVAQDAIGKQPVEQVGLHGRGLAMLPGIDRGHAGDSPPGGDRLWRLGHARHAASEQERQLQFVLRRLGAVVGDDAIDREPGTARVVRLRDVEKLPAPFGPTEVGHIILGEDLQIRTSSLPGGLMADRHGHPCRKPRLEMPHLRAMGDVFHLLEVVLDEADVGGIAAGHTETDELRAERKIVRADDRTVLAGEPVGAEAGRHEPVDDRVAGCGQRDVAGCGGERVGECAACMPWAIRLAQVGERAKPYSVAAGPGRRLTAQFGRRGRECRSEGRVAIGSTSPATSGSLRGPCLPDRKQRVIERHLLAVQHRRDPGSRVTGGSALHRGRPAGKLAGQRCGRSDDVVRPLLGQGGGDVGLERLEPGDTGLLDRLVVDDRLRLP